MSWIAYELDRIISAKEDLTNSIANKGVNIPQNTLLDNYASYIDNIPRSSLDENLMVQGYNSTNKLVKIKYSPIGYCSRAFENDNTIKKYLCGNNIVNMSYMCYNCQNLTGSPVCGNNVFDMSRTYYNCRNLTGSPVCGNNVFDMSFTYHNCRNLTGSPVCGSNVTDMYCTYYNCYNLTGSPVCGNNVVNMYGAYYNCRNLTGSPACGENVTNMYWTYYNCRNLTGDFMCGKNVTNVSYCFEYAINIRGNHYYNLCNQITTDYSVRNAYLYRNYNYRLNLFVNSSSYSRFTNTNAAYSIYGKDITWTNGSDELGNYVYNATYNTYIYNVTA